MLNNFPPVKRQKNDTDIIRKCLYCMDQRKTDGSCSHCRTHGGLATEYQQLRTASEDPTIDMEDIERRLRKLEARLTSQLHADTSSLSKQANPSFLPTEIPSLDIINSQSLDSTSKESKITLGATGINIVTNVREPHHFVKLLARGINPTFVQQKAIEVYSRPIDILDSAYDNSNKYQSISHLDIDNEELEERMWFDMMLTTRYSRCFLIYQMVEKDRLVEWVSPSFIDGLKGQVKLEHSLLAKSVRAFVYNHELASDSHRHGGATDSIRQRNINPNRGAFYFQQAEELLELCYMTSSRNTIRALLHMYMYQVMIPGGHLKAIQYSDLALRMAQGLKLNKEKGMLVNEQLREDDRRLWWSTVWVHVWCSLAFDRPILVEESDLLVPNARPPSKRQDESNQVGYCIDYCVQSVKLMFLSLSISKRLKRRTTEAKLLWELKDIEYQLDLWLLGLPEVLQPRYWNSENNQQQLMDDVHHDHQDARSIQAFGMELGLLLQGQWTMTRTHVYECFFTNDGSILDLLVTRNRLQAAVNYTNYVIQLAQRIQPCLLMYLLTASAASLTTLFTLTDYRHNTDIANQAVRQLYLLKTLFQHSPFTDNIVVQQWIHDIDQISPQQRLTNSNNNNNSTVAHVDWSHSISPSSDPTSNASISTSSEYYLQIYPQQHHSQWSLSMASDTNKPDNLQSSNFTTATTTTTSISLGPTGNIVDQNLQQQQQQHQQQQHQQQQHQQQQHQQQQYQHQQQHQRQQQQEWMASRTTTCDTHPAYNFTNDPIGKSSSTTSGQVQHYVPSAPSLNNYQFSTSSSSSSSSANNRVTGLPHFGQEYPSSVILSSSLTTTATASSSSLPVPPFHAKDQHYYHLQQEQQQHQHQQQPQQQQHYHHQHHQEYGQRSAKAMGKQPSWASDIYTGFDTNHYISYPPAPPGPPSSN